MNQVEEDSLYHSLEEESIDVDCLLVEPRSDQVSVSGVWCFEDDNRGKCIKTENVPYNLGGPDSKINAEGVNMRNLNERDVMPREVGNGVSPCDEYIPGIGYADHGACIDYVGNSTCDVMPREVGNGVSRCDEYIPGIGYADHGACIDYVGNSTSQSQFPMKASFGRQNSLTENISRSECQNYYLGNCLFTNSSESKNVDKLDDFSKSFIDQENNEDILPPHFEQNGSGLTPFCGDVPISSAQDHDAVTHKRSRKPTKRYIDESSDLSLKNCKKKREASSVSKVKVSGVGRPKHQNEVEPKEKMPSSEISFGKAIQVPFISQGPTECEKNISPAKKQSKESAQIENCIENYSSGSEDDSETMIKSMASGNQRKLHRLWTVSEVKKLIDGVAHFGVGKWTHIKKLLFSSSAHRTPVDLKDKWRNLLKASHALNGSRIEDEQKRSQPWRPLPKSILCRVRELATVYPYPREGNSEISKSKFPLAHHVSSPARIKGGNKVPVV